MKKHHVILAAILATIALTATATKAQNTSAPRLTATIPFEFNVMGQTLPAGEYIVTTVNPASPNTILQLKGSKGEASALIQTIAVIGKKQDHAKLVFRRYGDRYFLFQAWMSFDENGLAVQKSRAERELGNNRSDVKVRTATVALNAKR
jgi:hypothetical protein